MSQYVMVADLGEKVVITDATEHPEPTPRPRRRRAALERLHHPRLHPRPLSRQVAGLGVVRTPVHLRRGRL